MTDASSSAADGAALSFVIYTDGGADPNPGPGGWGAVVLPDGRENDRRELSGSAADTTNNRMELTAAIEALTALDDGSRVVLYTDSQYLRNGITKWMPGWRRQNWQRKGGALKNVDLWRRLDALTAHHTIDWRWVKGHAGDRWNERADALATEGVRAARASAPAATSSAAKRPAKRQPSADAPVDAEAFLAVSCPKRTGGWSAIVCRADDETQLGDRLDGVTANRLELLAAADLLERLLDDGARRVAVHGGSDYLRKGAALWLPGWRRKGWKTASGGALKNVDAWRRIDAIQRRLRVDWLRGDNDVSAFDADAVAARLDQANARAQARARDAS
ncbi:MAG: ribonuclease HI [Acidobacteriota bacterium]